MAPYASSSFNLMDARYGVNAFLSSRGHIPRAVKDQAGRPP